MNHASPQEHLQKARSRIADQVRSLRRSRHWTQAELASDLRLSQSRLSEIERGDGSFTAEQFLLILKLFNVATSHFSAGARDRGSEIQNALARLGAIHLQESTDVLPSEELENVGDVVREALVDGAPRLITALAPVLVHNVDRLSLNKLHLDLQGIGLQRRLAWVIDNTLAALRLELTNSLPRSWSQRCRRATVVLGAFLDSVVAARESGSTGLPASDVLDPSIRSKKSLDEVTAAASSISKTWGIVTRLAPEDFVEALRAARVED